MTVSTLDEALASRAKFAAKLARAQADMSPVPKDRTHQQGYKFQSADSIFAVCRPLLAKCGLALLPSVEVLDKATGQTAKGTPFEKATVRVSFALIDTETGYSEAALFPGEALDYNGMEVQKALTIAAKLFLKALFLVSESGDDPDEDDHQPARRETPRQAPPPRPTPTPAAPASPAPVAAVTSGSDPVDVTVPDDLPTSTSAFLSVVNAHRIQRGMAQLANPYDLQKMLSAALETSFQFGMLKDEGARRDAYRIAVTQAA